MSEAGDFLNPSVGGPSAESASLSPAPPQPPPSVESTSSPPPPPAPPPPPPSIISSQKQLCDSKETTDPIKSTSYNTFFSSSYLEARKAYQIFMTDHRVPEEERDSYAFISSYLPVRPVIQNGPLCGMVALSMATDLLNESAVSTDDIFNEASKAGYSLQGEMFSAHSMQKLASRYLCHPVQLLNVNHQAEKPDCLDGLELINSLLEGHCFLIPYDADKNHGPCLANGHKAHWALVTGFFAAFKKSSLTEIEIQHMERDTEVKSLYYWKDFGCDETVRDSMKHLLRSSIDVLVFAHQGKSKYCGIWNFRALLSSNNNLCENGPERIPENYIIPQGGVEEGLKAKVVLIQSNRS